LVRLPEGRLHDERSAGISVTTGRDIARAGKAAGKAAGKTPCTDPFVTARAIAFAFTARRRASQTCRLARPRLAGRADKG